MAGQPLVMALELNPNGGVLEVSAREAGKVDAWIWRLTLPGVPGNPNGGTSASPAALTTTSLPLGALYGREVIADLELEAAALKEVSPDHDQRIEKAGLRHRISSRMTSLVAVAEQPSVDPRVPSRRERLAVEIPAGVSPMGSGLMSFVGPMLFSISARLRPGSKAVDMGWEKLARLAGRPPGSAMVAAKRIAGTEPRQVSITRAGLLHAAPDAFTVEFETPADDFFLPEGEIHLWLDGATWLVARVNRRESSPGGPHAAGRVVRLALTLDGHPEWRQARVLELRWVSRPKRGAGDPAPLQITLSVAVPPDDAAAIE